MALALDPTRAHNDYYLGPSNTIKLGVAENDKDTGMG
jgi:hypothetical protein